MCLEHVKMKRMGKYMFTPEKKAALRVRKGYVRRLRLIELSEKQNHRCCYCGTQTWHMAIYDGVVGKRNKNTRASLEHVVAISNGGSYCKDNLVMACYECNNTRGNMSMKQFVRYITSTIKVKHSKKYTRNEKAKKYNNSKKGKAKALRANAIIVTAAMMLPHLFESVMNDLPEIKDKTLGRKTYVSKNHWVEIRKRVIENNMMFK